MGRSRWGGRREARRETGKLRECLTLRVRSDQLFRMRELLDKAHQQDDDDMFKEEEDDEEFAEPSQFSYKTCQVLRS